MTDDLNNTLKVLGEYTNGRYDVYAVAGPVNARKRAHLMTLLLRIKVPVRLSGINVLRGVLYVRAKIDTTKCAAEQDRLFVEFCKTTLGE